MADFNPALPLPIKWSIGEDRFNDDDEAKVLTLTIPVASLDQRTQLLLMSLVVSYL